MSDDRSPEKMDVSESSERSTPERPPPQVLRLLDNERTDVGQTSKGTNVTDCHPLMSPVSSEFPDLIRETSEYRNINGESATTLEMYSEQLPDFPESPTVMKKSLMYDMPLEINPDSSDTENDKSIYEAILSPNLQNVSLTMNEKTGNLNFLAHTTRSHKLRRIRVDEEAKREEAEDSDDASSVELNDTNDDIQTLEPNIIQDLLLDSPDDIDDSLLDRLDLALEFSEEQRNEPADPIEEYTAADERRDSRHWQKIVLPTGEQRSIDIRVIEPYKRVLSHGGYLKAGGHNAIVVFSACHLPDRSRIDYDYVMDNLFLYVLWTLDQLVTEDYVLVYLHGSASSNCMPRFSWLKRCYYMIDRRLKKNLKHLYLVHPTFWLKTVVLMTKPFISSKFYRKLSFVNSLQELTKLVPLEQASIPDRVINYDKLKFST